MNFSVISGLKEKFRDANQRSDVKAIVLTGTKKKTKIELVLIR